MALGMEAAIASWKVDEGSHGDGGRVVMAAALFLAGANVIVVVE